MRKALCSLVCWALCLLVSACAAAQGWAIAPYAPETLEIASNRHAQPREEGEALPFLDTEGFELIARTDEAELYLSRAYHTLRLVNRATGYVWGAIPLTDARNLNKSWKSYAASIVAIECYDQKNNEKRYGMAEDTVTADYTLTGDGFDCRVRFTALGVGMTVTVRLHKNALTFRVAEESIAEEGAYRLKSIAFMPYLGSVYGDETPGWFLLPDGPGALMRFRAGGSYVAGYDKRIYGSDLAVGAAQDAQSLNSYRPDDYVQKDAQVLMPVYGIAHGAGQNGLLCVVEDGALYASIAATPAGLGNSKYNAVTARFEVRQKYNMSTNQSGAGAAVPQEKRNAFSPALSVHLLAGAQADYDQMAVYYRELLRLRPLDARAPAMRVEALCAAARESALWRTTAALTTPAQALDIARALQADGVRSLFVLSRFTRGGQPGGAPTAGDDKALLALRSALEARGDRLCLWVDPVCANADQINLRLQAANGMNLSPIAVIRNNPAVMYPETYFFRPAIAARRLEEALTRYAGYALAVDQAGFRLYGDYTTGREVTRAQSAQLLQAALAQADIGAMYSPNQLWWGAADTFLDVPLVSGQYLYETDTVPFLPIVLSGSMEMYASAMNLGAYSRERMLRMLEYGVMPSFTVTACDSRVLSRTALSDYASTCFADWRAFMAETYHYMYPAMAAVCGQKIRSHTALAQGRVCVMFEGGACLLINYTDAPWQSAYGTVAPRDYLVGEECK